RFLPLDEPSVELGLQATLPMHLVPQLMLLKSRAEVLECLIKALDFVALHFLDPSEGNRLQSLGEFDQREAETIYARVQYRFGNLGGFLETLNIVIVKRLVIAIKSALDLSG